MHHSAVFPAAFKAPSPAFASSLSAAGSRRDDETRGTCLTESGVTAGLHTGAATLSTTNLSRLGSFLPPPHPPSPRAIPSRPPMISRHTVATPSAAWQAERGITSQDLDTCEYDTMDIDMDIDGVGTECAADHDDPSVLYREMYSKFSGTRRDISTRSSTRSGQSPYAQLPELDSASTLSSVMLLTPPPLLRKCTLPPLMVDVEDSADLEPLDNGIDFSQDLPSPVDKVYIQKIPPFVPKPAPATLPDAAASRSAFTSTNLQGLRSSPYMHRSPFVHIPERRLAPKRTIDTSQTDTVWPPTCARKALQDPIPPIAANNSLGLEVDSQHIEYSLTPPFDDADIENREPVSISRKRQVGNPVSPPNCRSPLVSLQIASALSALDLPDEGLRSVEATKYELGKQGAEYIARRLAEEQKRRQAKEKAAGTEERGRSRAKKRTASYSSGSILG